MKKGKSNNSNVSSELKTFYVTLAILFFSHNKCNLMSVTTHSARLVHTGLISVFFGPNLMTQPQNSTKISYIPLL